MKAIRTAKAPNAVGPYSQAIVANGFVYCSGQIGLVPKTGVLAAGIKKQTEQVLRNVRAILKEAGAGFDSVVSVNVYLRDMDDFKEVNEVYAKTFSNEPKPARVTVGVSALPKDALIEISCVAYVS